VARPPGRVGWAVPTPGECHLWLVPVRHRAGWPALLDPAERQRAARLAGTPAGDVFVTSRGAQRLVGSGYLGIPPTEVTTDRDCPHCRSGGIPHGRPRFRAAPIDYSVSHTDCWVVLAVTGTGLVGVDIEALSATLDADSLARVVLTAGEQREFSRLPVADQPGWLLAMWTRKEAAMKLTGLGLRAPPRLLDVRAATVSTTIPGWPADRIHLYSVAGPEGHVSALATTVPLVGLRRFDLPDDAAPRAAANAAGGTGPAGRPGRPGAVTPLKAAR
jgi:4'-phosphopantetheinyl transferase